eukprot:jgi/Galph1/1068/GphlegSOOS_G5896.1
MVSFRNKREKPSRSVSGLHLLDERVSYVQAPVVLIAKYRICTASSQQWHSDDVSENKFPTCSNNSRVALEGLVQRVLFESKSSKYSVLEVTVSRCSHGDLEGKTCQVVGYFGASEHQGIIAVEGDLVYSNKYGQQLKVKQRKQAKKNSAALRETDMKIAEKGQDVLEVRVKRVVFASETDPRYVVMQCIVNSSKTVPKEVANLGMITVISRVGPLELDSEVVVAGKWVQHEKYGFQFHATSISENTVVEPKKVSGGAWMTQTIENYLSAHIVPGIGPGTAKRLVNCFGNNTEEVLEKGSLIELMKVPGLREKNAQALIDHFQQKGALRKATLGLMSFGFPLSLVSRVLKRYGITKASFLVENDPYALVTDLKGVGFKTIDRIARTLNPKFVLGRYRAAIILALNSALKDGHCFLYSYEQPGESKMEELERTLCHHVKKLIVDESTPESVYFDHSLFTQSLDELQKGKRVIKQQLDMNGVKRDLIYLPSLYRNEVNVALRLKKYSNKGNLVLSDWKVCLENNNLSSEQLIAVKQSVFSDNPLTIITGGPGSGKTFTACRIVELWKAKYGVENIALAAPTGRAAARLTESTKMNAQTIHRLLEYQPRSGKGGFFKRNRHRPLEYAALLIDEFSMVDIEMFSALLNALRPTTKVVLIGDMFQLPSVGPGQVLRDMCSSKQFPVCHLQILFRQEAKQSSLVEAALQIRNGVIPVLETVPSSCFFTKDRTMLTSFFANMETDILFVEENDASQGVGLIQQLLDSDIWLPKQISPYHDIQVISPGTKGTVGTIQLNRELREQLNPCKNGQEQYHFGGSDAYLDLKVGDRVIQKVNDYTREVYNGDIGTIENFDVKRSTRHSSKQTVHVRFIDRLVSYSAEDVVLNLSHAYALTVHKSQGSEFPIVILSLFPMHYTLFSRSLLYTAITRAKKLCIIVGSKRALAMCIKQNRERQRNSLLSRRLQDEHINYYS